MHAEQSVSDVVVKELVVGHCSVMKQVHEDKLIVDERTCYVRILKSGVWHCKIVDVELLINEKS